MGRLWKGSFQDGDLVEYIGEEDDEGWPVPGERGTLITAGDHGDPPPEWVVAFPSGTAVFATRYLRPARMDFEVREVQPGGDRVAVDAFLEERSALLVARLGELVDAREHPAVVAEEGGRVVGVITYVIDGDRCELLTVHAAERQRGIGKALFQRVRRIAVAAGCRAIWVITTNDNLDALRFYQRLGFQLVKLRPGALAESRRLKPGIPAIGEYGIFINDELELHKTL
jgi:ribosomal protein S18 acetylase RimI-like enzyme